jgi:Uncharacterized conserved protein
MFKFKHSIIAVLALASATAYGEVEIKGTPTELSQYLQSVPRRATFTGEAEVRVPAHRAVVSLRIATESRSMQEALRLNQGVRTKVIGQLKQRGIADDRINTTRFSSTPRPGVFTDKARSFKVENVLRVTVTDDAEFSAIAIVVDGISEAQFAGVEFEYADKETSKEKALKQACDKVNQHRRIYEQKFGVRLVPVSFQEGEVIGGDVPARVAYGQKAFGFSSMAPVDATLRGANQAEADGSASSFGEMIYTAHVAVEFTVHPQ